MVGGSGVKVHGSGAMEHNTQDHVHRSRLLRRSIAKSGVEAGKSRDLLRDKAQK